MELDKRGGTPKGVRLPGTNVRGLGDDKPRGRGSTRWHRWSSSRSKSSRERREAPPGRDSLLSIRRATAKVSFNLLTTSPRF